MLSAQFAEITIAIFIIFNVSASLQILIIDSVGDNGQ